MHGYFSIAKILLSDDKKIQRQVGYWSAAAVLYSIDIGLLWFAVSNALIPAEPAIWLTSCIVVGALLFYVLIRSSKRLKIRPSQMAYLQGVLTIPCILAGYAISASLRGAVLSLLLVNLLFCAFALDAKKAYRLSLLAIVLHGALAAWLTYNDPVRFNPGIEAFHFLLTASALVAMAYIIGEINRLRARINAQKGELANALVRIREMATHDELTTLANRRYMSELLAKEDQARATHGQSLCIALIDLDLFKQINDTHGHAAGDAVLRIFARHAQAALRACDIFARWGGEEFLLCLPNIDLQNASLILERLKSHVSALRFPDIDPGLYVTFSAGLIALQDGESVNEGIIRADHYMYEAKLRGRNCVALP